MYPDTFMLGQPCRVRVPRVQDVQGSRHLLARAGHQPHPQALQRAVRAPSAADGGFEEASSQGREGAEAASGTAARSRG